MNWINLPPIWLLGFLLLGAFLARLFEASALPAPMALGSVLVAVGASLMVWAAAHMVRRKTTPIPHRHATNLVTDGPFRLSRNPIYLGDALVLTGAYLWWGIWWALPLVAVFGWIITRLFIAPEERRLRDDFGAAFGDYCAKTRRWI